MTHLPSPINSLAAQSSGSVHTPLGNGGLSAAPFAVAHQFRRLSGTQYLLRVFREDPRDPVEERINVDDISVSSAAYIRCPPQPPDSRPHRSRAATASGRLPREMRAHAVPQAVRVGDALDADRRHGSGLLRDSDRRYSSRGHSCTGRPDAACSR